MNIGASICLSILIVVAIIVIVMCLTAGADCGHIVREERRRGRSYAEIHAMANKWNWSKSDKREIYRTERRERRRNVHS